MWVHTDLGFMSVVEYDPSKDPARKAKAAKGEKKYPHVSKRGTHVLVRARVRADLDDLKAYFPKLIVDEDSAADYRFRAVLPKKTFALFMASKVMDIDYGSHFKEVVEDRLGAAQGKAAGKLRHGKLMSIWTALAQLQPYGAYGVTDPANQGKWTSTSGWTGTSKYATVGRFGKTYAEALGGDLKDVPPGHDYVDTALWDEVLDGMESTLGYDEATRRLGWDSTQFSVPELVEELRKNEWSLALGYQSDFKDLGDDAFELYLILLERFGEGTVVSEKIVQEVIAEIEVVRDDNAPEAEINSLPLDQPVN